jgi:hypothetical protein
VGGEDEAFEDSETGRSDEIPPGRVQETNEGPLGEGVNVETVCRVNHQGEREGDGLLDAHKASVDEAPSDPEGVGT